MSFFKDQWNLRYMERYDECIEGGMSQQEAHYHAERFAEGTAELLADQADNLRKASREQS